MKTAFLNKTGLAGTALALTLSLAAPAPALAWGENEQNFVSGIAAALLLGTVAQGRHGQPAQTQPVRTQPVQAVPLHQTPAAQAFNSYGGQERRAIQRKLASYGYYRSGIDGQFGMGTYNAVVAYARDSGNEAQLQSRNGAFGLLDSLLY